MQACRGPHGRVGAHMPRAELHSNARSHHPIAKEPPQRSTTSFALLLTGRPVHLTPEKGVAHALLGDKHMLIASRPRTSTSFRLKADLPISMSDKALLRQVQRAKPPIAMSRAVSATELCVSCTDNAGILAKCAKIGHHGPRAVAELRASDRFAVSWNQWAPPAPPRPLAGKFLGEQGSQLLKSALSMQKLSQK